MENKVVIIDSIKQLEFLLRLLDVKAYKWIDTGESILECRDTVRRLIEEVENYKVALYFECDKEICWDLNDCGNKEFYNWMEGYEIITFESILNNINNI